MTSAAARQPRTSPPPPAGGRWFFILLGLSVAMVGGVFVWLMARSYLRARDMRQWPEVPCVILVSEIQQRVHDAQSPAEFRHVISFGYEWRGEARTSDRLSLRGIRKLQRDGVIGTLSSDRVTGRGQFCVLRSC